MEGALARVLNIPDIHHTIAARVPAVVARDMRIDGWFVRPLLNRMTRDGVTVHLRAQVMDLLVCLAGQPGVVITRDELLASVWEGRYVSSSAISRCICELRTALGDDAQRPRVIETVAKRGYRLIAKVEPAPAAGITPPTPCPVVDSAAGRSEVAASPPRPWQRLSRAAWRLVEKGRTRMAGLWHALFRSGRHHAHPA